MRLRRLTSVASMALFILVAAAAGVHAEQSHLSPSPDRILKGTTPIITIELKNIPDLKDIASVTVAGQGATIQEPRVGGTLTIQLPKLDFVGRADVVIVDKNNATVGVAQLNYVESAEPAPPSGPRSPRGLVGLLLIYVLLIVFLPWSCTLYDIHQSYKERATVLRKFEGKATIDEFKTLLVDMNQGPTGLVGLTRGIIAVTIILTIAVAVFHLVVFVPQVPDIAEKLLMLLTGTLTAIVGFYYGSKAVTQAVPQAPPSGDETQVFPVPKIKNVEALAASGKTELTVSGEGFEDSQGKGSLTIKNTEVPVEAGAWKNNQIRVTLSKALEQGVVSVLVKNGHGKQSEPYLLTIK